MKAMHFKSEVIFDLQGQKGKKPTSSEEPNYGCSDEVPNSVVLTKYKVTIKHPKPETISLNP